MAEQSLEEIFKRLDELESKVTLANDIEEIKQLTIRYLTGHTLNDGELEAEGFADDATCIIDESPPLVGKKAIREFTVNHAKGQRDMIEQQSSHFRPMKPIPTAGHFILHPVITVDGDKAKGTWMQYCLTAEVVTMHLLHYVQALYDIEYVKRDGKWQIHYLNWTPRITPRG